MTIIILMLSEDISIKLGYTMEVNNGISLIFFFLFFELLNPYVDLTFVCSKKTLTFSEILINPTFNFSFIIFFSPP